MKFKKGDTIRLRGGKTAVVEYENISATTNNGSTAVPELVIKNAVVVDSLGVFKTDIEIAKGRISGLGRSVESGYRHIDCEGRLITVGKIFTADLLDGISAEELLFSGFSTVIVNGGINTKNLAALVGLPVNFGFTAEIDGLHSENTEELYSSGIFKVFAHGNCPDTEKNEIADNDVNFQIKNEIARQTVCAAAHYGLSEHIGTVAVGKIADLFIWGPDNFLKKPSIIIKDGRVIFDDRITDRRDIIYTQIFDSSTPAKSRSVFFTSRAAVEGYIGKTAVTERAVIAVGK